MLTQDRRRRVVLTLTLSAMVAACSSPAASTAPTEATTAVPPAPTLAASPTQAAAFPVTVTDDEGTAIEIASEPETIVSLTPANTEILFALGAGDRVVATDDGSDYPEAAVALPDVATFATVDVEKVVALEPDLVVAGGLGFTPDEAITRLRGLDIPVVVVYAPSVDGVYDDIELIGTATGTERHSDDPDRRHARGDRFDQRRGIECGHQAARASTKSATTTRPARSMRPQTRRSSPRW